MNSVAANLAWMVPGGVGGSEEYTVRLLAAVIANNPEDISLEIVASRQVLLKYPWMASHKHTILGGPLENRLVRLMSESTSVYRATRKCNLVHHFGGRMPAVRNSRSVFTIHDLQPLENPQNFSFRKRRYLEWAIGRSAKNAKLICTPSQWVKESVSRRLGVRAERIRVVPSTWESKTLPSSFAGQRHSSQTSSEKGADRLIEELKDRPVLVYPAATHPHKNHMVLLDAVDQLAKVRPDIALVLTGGPGRAESEVAMRIGQCKVDVWRLGHVAASLVRTLVDRADILVFPSIYEGFGLPLLEAMHAGTPIVASNAAAIPEVLADAGVLLPPHQPEQWAQALDEVLANPELAKRLSNAGKEQAKKFAPSMAAERLLNVWREVA